MSEIRIILTVQERSGILARAITSLHRSGLQFKTQQRLEASDDCGQRLALDADGELPDPGSLVDQLSSLRGVEGIDEIILDGNHILGGPAVNGFASEPEPEPSAQAVARPVPKPEPEPEPEPEAKPAAKPARSAASNPPQPRQARAAHDNHGAATGKVIDPHLPETTRMRRRWRQG